MFHGPAYQGVTEMHAMGTDGLRATVTCRPAPGALLDAAGQLLGYWIEANSTEDRIALPMRIDRIDVHGPHPEPGAQLDCVVRFTEVNETDARRQRRPRPGRPGVGPAHPVHRPPVREHRRGVRGHDVPRGEPLAERRDGYWIVHEPWRSSASRDLLARRYLGEAERDAYYSV